MGTHSSILAWRIPRTEEPGGLRFLWLQRVGHDFSTAQHKPIRLSFPWLFLSFLFFLFVCVFYFYLWPVFLSIL